LAVHVHQPGRRGPPGDETGPFAGAVWETGPPAQDARFRDEFTRAVEQRVFVCFEAFYRPTQRWYEYRCHPRDDGLTVLFCDATEHKQMEEALRERERRYRKLFEAPLAGAYITKLDGAIVDFNDTMMKMLGYDAREELSRKNSSELYADPELRQELIRLLHRDGIVPGRVAVLKRKDGRLLYALGSAVLLTDGQTGETFIQGVALDITERKQAEEALRESEQRFRAVLENSLDVAYRQDLRNNRYDYISPAVERTTGFTPQEVNELPRAEQFARIHPDDAERVQQEFARAMKKGTGAIEYRFRRKDGTYCWLADYFVVEQDEAGRPRYRNGNLRNITELKEAEVQLQQWNERLGEQVAQRTEELTRTIEQLHGEVTRRVQVEETLRRRSQMLEAFFQHTIAPLAFLDRHFNFVRVNEAFARDAGNDPDFFVGKNLFAVYPPVGSRAIFDQVVQTKQPYRAYAVPYTFPEAPQRERGATYWNWWLTPLLDERGEVQFLVWSLEDVTEQQKAMQELQERARQLQQLSLELSQTEDRERKRLAEILHDDLQQILAAAKFQVGLLGSQVKSEAERREMTEQIKQILKDAIDKSRSLSHELNPPGLSYRHLFEAFEWLASEVQARHGLLVHLDACTPVELSSEPLRAFLYRAAQEMLFNVIKHAHVEEAQLRLCRHGGRVFLSVADRGHGFDPRQLGGTRGLGLVSLRERVTLLGGRMRIKSAPGRGSVFVVVVPDAEPPAPETQGRVGEEPVGAPAAASGAAHESPRSHRLRVLLVDDHKIVREGIQLMLAGEPDIEIVGQAGNGREAVELARRLRPDVVVMDVSMPVMSGDEATRRIRQDLPQTRVVALSMHDSAAVAERMRGAGAAAYLLKTAPADDLLAAIRGRAIALRT
jgi:PAS domain S-box-containing protein